MTACVRPRSPAESALPEDEGRAGRRAHQELVQDPEVPLPDHRDPVEDRDEEDALREDPGRHEVDVAQVSRRDGAHAGEDLAEDQQPQRRLHRPGEHLGGVVQELPRLHPGDREGRREIVGHAPTEARRGAGLQPSRRAERAFF